MKHKKQFTCFLVFVIICSFFSQIFASTLSDNTNSLESTLDCGACILMEQSTGKIVYEKNAYERKFPASTTKILTAILTIENCNLDDEVVASENAIMQIPSGYSTAAIQIGETLTVRDLLYTLMVTSANESAVILAEHISGSEEAFCELMNEKAKELGCKDSNFVNPNGIHDENHYSTAYDLALITRYAMNNETFREVVKTEEYSLPVTDLYPNDDRNFYNTNSLIIPDNTYYYAYATGVKTGYTSDAGNCLVSSAEKNDMKYVAVVLNAPQTYQDGQTISHKYFDSIQLFDFGFNNYSYRKFKTTNDIITTLSIENGKKDNNSLNVVIGSDVDIFSNIDNINDEYDPKITINDNLVAPIKKGDVVGSVVYRVDGLKYTAELLAGNDVEATLDIATVTKNNSTLFLIPIGIILIFIIIRVTIRSINLNLKKNKLK